MVVGSNPAVPTMPNTTMTLKVVLTLVFITFFLGSKDSAANPPTYLLALLVIFLIAKQSGFRRQLLDNKFNLIVVAIVFYFSLSHDLEH